MAASPKPFLDYHPPTNDDEYDVMIPGPLPEAGPLLEFSADCNPGSLEFQKYLRGENDLVGPAEILRSIRHKGDALVGINGVCVRGTAAAEIQKMLTESSTKQFLLLRLCTKKRPNNGRVQMLEEEIEDDIQALEDQEKVLERYRQHVLEEKERKVALKKKLQKARMDFQKVQRTIEELEKEATESILRPVKTVSGGSFDKSISSSPGRTSATGQTANSSQSKTIERANGGADSTTSHSSSEHHKQQAPKTAAPYRSPEPPNRNTESNESTASNRPFAEASAELSPSLIAVTPQSIHSNSELSNDGTTIMAEPITSNTDSANGTSGTARSALAPVPKEQNRAEPRSRSKKTQSKEGRKRKLPAHGLPVIYKERGTKRTRRIKITKQEDA